MAVQLYCSGSLRVLDLENCENLREVQLGSSSAAVAGGGGAAAVASREGEASQQQQQQQPSLVLRGCGALPQGTRAALRAAVLGR